MSFDDRERAFENRFAHDEEMKFKALSRRNRLLGQWAAGHLGHTGEAAEQYAREVVRADFEEVGHEDVYRKVKRDFDAAGVAVTEAEIRAKMSELLVKAADEIASAEN